MTRPLRLQYPGSIWHITARGNEKRDIFRDDRDRLLFLRLLEKAVGRCGWILFAYVLMSNHYHLFLELTRETLSRGMHWLNGRYAQAFNRRHERVGHLLQGRFGQVLVEEETYFNEVLRYVVLNPVRAGIVERPEDYAWSSYRATAGLDPAPAWLAVDRALLGFGRRRPMAEAEYRRFVAAGIGDTTRLWDSAVGQVYLGSDEWIERVEEEIGESIRSDEYPQSQIHPRQLSMADVIDTVAATLSLTSKRVRQGHGGMPRMLAAWTAWHEGQLDLRSIAAGLRFRSAGHVSRLIARCERDLRSDGLLNAAAERCTAALRSVGKRKKERPDPNKGRRPGGRRLEGVDP